jgi:dephospho-CoA kinase
MANKIIAIVGMPGSGKTEAANFFASKGFQFIRLGQLTLDEVKKRGLVPGEASERPIREELRKKYGMAALAILNFPKIDKMLKKRNVVVDGLYSWEEYIEFKKKYGKNVMVLSICASPETRYKRLTRRKWDKKRDPEMKNRAYSMEGAKARDKVQLENLHTGPPIAMADATIINEGSFEELKKTLEKFYKKIEK